MTRAGAFLVVLAAVLLAAGPLGTRATFWTYRVGFILLAASVLLALVGAGLSLVGAITTGQWGLPATAVAIAAAILAFPLTVILSGRGAPAIHEITTDPEDPPQFVAAPPRRATAVNPPQYGGATVAEQQRRAYPDIQPIVLRGDAPHVFQRALTVARDLGWDAIDSDAATGRIEAVDTTFWFGFKDDVVVRIRGTSAGTRVDARSKSRVGVGDLGANARRVRAFLDAMRAQHE